MQPSTTRLEVPDGPPEYKAGWHDGCSSALSSLGFRNARFYRQDFGSGIYHQDSLYQTAWSSAWFACSAQVGDFVSHPGLNVGPLE